MTAAGETIEQAATSVTAYVILRASGGVWEVIDDDRRGRDAAAAIRATVETLAEGDQDGTFIAVPLRSWRPVKVKTKVERTLVVEDAQ